VIPKFIRVMGDWQFHLTTLPKECWMPWYYLCRICKYVGCYIKLNVIYKIKYNTIQLIKIYIQLIYIGCNNIYIQVFTRICYKRAYYTNTVRYLLCNTIYARGYLTENSNLFNTLQFATHSTTLRQFKL